LGLDKAPTLNCKRLKPGRFVEALGIGLRVLHKYKMTLQRHSAETRLGIETI